MRMSLRRGLDREEFMLLPERLEDYVTCENPVRAVDAFVENLDLSELGFEERKKVLGAPSYDPKALLKLYIYGFLNRIRSSRELEKATKRNLEVIWLMRKLQPDHWTINSFRKTNKDHFKAVFRQFNLLCGKLDLFGHELVAIDSAFFKAVNNASRNYTANNLKIAIKAADAQTEKYLALLESSDPEGTPQQLTERGSMEAKLASLKDKSKELQSLLKQVKASPTRQISLNDPDSRRLKKPSESVVGYQVQIAVDEKNHLIAVNETFATGGDSDHLLEMSTSAKEALGAQELTVVTDGGYFNIDQIKACEESGIEVHMPIRKTRAAGEGVYSLKDFKQEEERDVFICPAGRELHRHENTRLGNDYYKVYYNTQACRECPSLKKCTKGKYRKIKIHVDAQVVDQMRERMMREPEKLKKRGSLVEHPFGSMKFWMGARALLTCGWNSVRGEINLTCLAYNFRRALNLVGVPKLLEVLSPKAA